MDIEFQDSELESLAFDSTHMGKWSPAVVRAYRRRINQLMQVPDRQVLYAIPSLRLKKLKGKLKHQHSIRLNDQFRLIVEIKKKKGYEIIVIIRIGDYH